ncbi:MAG: alpha-glucosidase C-terminal domain-containing protein [Tyzzerella sp.]|uniref:Alpha-glucosidase C-terminal domain-containing protein n=1 Tax=Candidatus Fimicola merdigallinarum TaxID=2840819 RepID=A0A9D9H195_9FIRM|nr:alpha-glucosidase C-terminal domain-containing protein [Candidatus Fimicola merdigallinarum]
MEVIKNYKDINVKNQINDSNFILSHYKKLISLRKSEDIIAYGNFKPLAENHKQIFAYEREYKGESIIVINNFYEKETEWESEINLTKYKCILSNYENINLNKKLNLRPYESIVLKSQSY